MNFVIEKEIFQALPDMCVGVVVAKGVDNSKSCPAIEELLNRAIAVAEQRFSGKKVKEAPEILPYREAFRTLGINPNKYMCSMEALFTRISKGKGNAPYQSSRGSEQCRVPFKHPADGHARSQPLG